MYICYMKGVIIGSGNVATHLANAFSRGSVENFTLYARNPLALAEVSKSSGYPIAETLPNAEFYLIAVADDAVAEVSSKISYSDCLVAHTSGSLSREISQGNYRKACFYPMQTFSKQKEMSYSEIPVFVEAENPKDLNFLTSLAQSFTQSVMQSSYVQRRYAHLTAVFACNFVNHLFTRANEISDSQNIPFNYFYPLIEETVEKIQTLDPKLAQTGPAIRNDQRVIEMHKNLITDPTHAEIYDVMTRSIQALYHSK